MKTVLFVLVIFIIMGKNTELSAQSDILKTDLSIIHIVKYPSTYEADKPNKKYSLILTLHGHGSNENDLIGLSTELQNDLFWVSGRGPQTFGNNAYDWYQLPPSPEKIAAVLKRINIFIEELKTTYPIDTSNVFLMGFSQGSMIALSYAMAFPESISGVIAQSGAIPSNIGLEINNEGLQGKPIIITHGIEDRMMPIERGRQTRDFLKELKVDITFKEFHMGHTINSQSISAVKQWLDLKLKK